MTRWDAGNQSRVTLPSTTVEPALPQAVGPLSATILDLLHRGRPALQLRPTDVPVCEADPYALDLQLALYACYELHYRGFAGVNPRWEWNPALLQVRARLEEAFLSAVRHDVGDIGAGRHGRDGDGRAVGRADRRRGPVVLPSRQGHLGADARVLRASLAVSPQGGRSACLGDSPPDRTGQGVLCRRRVRRVRRRPRRARCISTCSPS